MKVAVSIPDAIQSEADRFAARIGTSRSALYAMALAEYLKSHTNADVTEQLDAVLDGLEAEAAAFVRRSAEGTIARSEW